MRWAATSPSWSGCCRGQLAADGNGAGAGKGDPGAGNGQQHLRLPEPMTPRHSLALLAATQSRCKLDVRCTVFSTIYVCGFKGALFLLIG